MLSILLPDNCRAERSWIASIVLRDFLGLPFEIRYGDYKSVQLHAVGKTIDLSDAFFNQAAQEWLSISSIPSRRLQQWCVAECGLTPQLVNPTVPVLFGTPGFQVHADGNATLSLDIFGSAFFMLSRYEEAVTSDRDGFDRFPVTAALGDREQFQDRPIVDEYVEILWAALHRVWPMLERKLRCERILVSCDVDSPFDPACASLPRLGKRLIGQTVRDRSPARIINTINNYVKVRNGDYSYDPYRSAIDWIMEVNERVGNQVAFYFIPEQTDPEMDNDGDLDDPRMRAMLRIIHSRGHEIGIHPGFNTYKHPAAFARSVDKLRGVLEQESIRQDVLGGRQHYLRWDAMTTPQLWDSNGLQYDSTLSYADRPGFRCGTCHEYRMYSLAERKPLGLLQRPLIVMEGSVIDALYLGLGYTDEALAMMQRYKNICRQFHGNFTLLWHNSCLQDDAAKHICCEIIKW